MTFKIVFEDNIEFIVSQDIINKSSVLQSMFIDRTTISIYDIEPHIFKHILTFITYTVNSNTTQLEQNQFIKDMVSNMDCNTLIDLIHGSKLLEIDTLVNVVGGIFKSIVQNNSVSDIRKIFRIKNDFTVEEEIQVEQSFKWF
jgi:S-phase kinase-associated protein 1